MVPHGFMATLRAHHMSVEDLCRGMKMEFSTHVCMILHVDVTRRFDSHLVVEYRGVRLKEGVEQLSCHSIPSVKWQVVV